MTKEFVGIQIWASTRALIDAVGTQDARPVIAQLIDRAVREYLHVPTEEELK